MFTSFFYALNCIEKRNQILIPYINFKAILVLLIICILSLKLGFSQSPSRLITFEKEKLEIHVSETFTNSLLLFNSFSEDLEIQLESNFNEIGFFRLPENLVLKSGERKTFPLKFIATKENIQHVKQVFTLKAFHKNQLIDENQFMTELKDAEAIFLTISSREIYFNKKNQQGNFELNVINAGIIPKVYKIRAIGLPSGIELKEAELTDTISALDQHVLALDLRTDKPVKEDLDQWFHLELLDKEDKILATQNLRILSVSNRRYLYSSQNTVSNRYKAHQSRFYYVNSDTRNSSQLYLSGLFSFQNNWKASYEMNYNNFWDGDRGLLYNSFIDVGNQHVEFRLGSLYENLNFNVNGKGLKATYKRENNQLSAYILDSDMVLLGENAYLSPQGYTTALSYTIGNGTAQNTRLIGLYQNDLKLDLKSAMLYWKQSLISNNKHQLTAEISGSHEQRAADELKNKHFGYLFSANYQFKSDIWQINGQHTLSSPFYVGLNRGLHQMDYFANRKLNENFFANLRLNNSRTRIEQSGRYLGEFVNLVNDYSQENYQLGLLWRTNSHWSFGFDPYLFRQSMSSFSFSKPNDLWDSEAWRFRLNINHSNQLFSTIIYFDQGFAEINRKHFPTKRFYSNRINSTFQRKPISLNLYYQFNPYYITDAFISQMDHDYSTFSIEPKFNFSGFKGKLDASTSFLYYYYGNSKSQNYILNGRVNWLLKNQWELTAEFYFGINRLERMLQYNPEQGLNTNPQLINVRDPNISASRQIRFGVSKFYGRNSDSNTAKIKLTYYHDLNNNGIQDKNEPIVPDIQVSMKDIAALSNKDGLVEFIGLKEQEYFPLIKHNLGWVVSKKFNQQSLFLVKDISLKVPLIKLERLRGKVNILKEKYKTTLNNLSGIKVFLQDEYGDSYETSTNVSGEFNIYLPATTYLIQLLTSSIPIKVVNPIQHIQVLSNRENFIEFEALNTTRHIDLQKF